MAIMRLFNNKQALMFIQGDQGTRPDQAGWLDSHWLEVDSPGGGASSPIFVRGCAISGFETPPFDKVRKAKFS